MLYFFAQRSHVYFSVAQSKGDSRWPSTNDHPTSFSLTTEYSYMHYSTAVLPLCIYLTTLSDRSCIVLCSGTAVKPIYIVYKSV